MTEPIPYATPLPARSNHDRIYSALLGALLFFLLIPTLEMWFLSRRPGQPAETIWVMQLLFAIFLCFWLFVAGVLVIRIAFPAHRKWPTVALNIVMLMWIPFGTALGIYGLWKVDKSPSLSEP